jgi:hypothetical protein
MSRENDSERRLGIRHIISLPIRVEWSEDGKHIVEVGNTENIGPGGALIHLPNELPMVGSQVKLFILENETLESRFQTTAEVLRLERNAAHPLAALQLVEESSEWQEKVWEDAAARIAQAEAEIDYDDF